MSSYSYLRRKMAKKTLYDAYGLALPQIGAPGGNAGVGKVFYVNGSDGSDSSDGNHNSPFKTITYALTKCTDRNDDTILVTRDTTEAAYPVSINKRDIHIFGWCEPNRLGADKVYYSSSSAACFEIAEQNVEIAGFDFVATSGYPAIQFANSSYWNASIHDNVFGRRGALKDGIYCGASPRDAAYMSVYDNYFAPGVVRDGVRFEGAGTYGWIGLPGHGNVFDVAVIGINATVSIFLGGIVDNKFCLPSDTAGYAITFSTSGSGEAKIDGNSAFYGKAALSTNPYRDLGSNHWGLNYRQGVSILPAIV